MPRSDNFGKTYDVTSSGTNSQGNHYCNRDYGTGQPAYHYSNANGSYYYQNANGSTYYNNGQGSVTYNPPNSGSSQKK